MSTVLPQQFHCGSAARCEAGLCPAVRLLREIGLCPWYGLWPKTSGQSPNQGHSPHIKYMTTAGHSPASHPAAEPVRSICGTQSDYSPASHPAAEPVRSICSTRSDYSSTSHPAAEPVRSICGTRSDYSSASHPAAEPVRSICSTQSDYSSASHPAAEPISRGRGTERLLRQSI